MLLMRSAMSGQFTRPIPCTKAYESVRIEQFVM